MEELFYKNRCLEDLKGEEWAKIDFEDGKYYVSTKGRVKSLKNPLKPIIMKQYLGKNYLSVNLRSKNLFKLKKVHRLVAIAFIPNPENKPQVNHKNGCKVDARLENLEWNTQDENFLHSVLVLKKNKLSSKKEPKGFVKGKTTYVYLSDGSLYKKCHSKTEAIKLTGISKINLNKETGYKSILGFTFSNKPLKEKIIIKNFENKVYKKVDPAINKTKLARKKVYIYNLKGEFIKEYQSISDAVKVFSKKIHKTLKGKSKTINGYVPMLTKHDQIEDLSQNENILRQYKAYNVKIIPLESL
jgi:hypothetical protein